MAVDVSTPPYDFSKRSFWGWGWSADALTPEQLPLDGIEQRLQLAEGSLKYRPAPSLNDIKLAPPRLKPPAQLADCFSDDKHERAAHCYGRATRDLIRALDGRFDCAPDWIALPSDKAQLAAILDWCESQQAAVIPYGGGSSVAGGVEARPPMDGYNSVVTLDMRRMNQVLEIDRTSRSAHLQAGIYGPDLEAQLRPHGLTLRHYPQSFEFSTLGGWIATRSGGHYATRYTHIEDFVAGSTLLAPAGELQNRRLPGSGAGPDGNRWVAGSEGTAGVITSAWMRLQDRPDSRAATVVRFAEEAQALDAVRTVAQSGLEPANLRLVSPLEAANTGLGQGPEHCLLLGFEGKGRKLKPLMDEALALCRPFGGKEDEVRISEAGDQASRQRDDSSGAWRSSFIRAPYGRDFLTCCGLIVETFETAITWDAFPAMHRALAETIERALGEHCVAGQWSWRFTHVYPDGPAPYYSITAKGLPGGDRIEQWDAIKTAVSDTLIAAGATSTHHHAVGRDHRPWHLMERSPLMQQAQKAALRTLDPAGIMNPGALW